MPDIPADTKLHYQKIPLTQIATLSAAFSPLIAAFQAARQAVGNAAIGGEGLYRVTFNGKAGALARAKDGSGFLGNVINPGHGVNGLARLKLPPLQTYFRRFIIPPCFLWHLHLSVLIKN